MAKVASLFLVVSLVAVAISTVHVEGLGGVGGKQEIKDVKSNGEIQQLGRFCVTEYNKGIKLKKKLNQDKNGILLSFSEVVKAEKQVVAGLKYYLRIAAAAPDGEVKTFDAEVVLKPGENAKELVTFAPSTLN